MSVREQAATSAVSAMGRASAWATASNLVAKVQILCLSFAASRLLTVDAFGTFFTLIGIFYFTVALADFGMTSFFEYEVASGRLEPQDVLQVAEKILRFSMPIFLVVSFSVVQIVVKPSTQQILPCVVLGGWILVALTNGMHSAGLIGNMQYARAALTSIVGRGLSAVLLVLIVGLSDRSAAPTVLLSAALLAGELCCLAIYLHRTIARRNFRLRHRIGIKYLAPYLINNLSNSAYARGDVPIVASLAGTAAAGLYAPASQMQSMLMLVPTLISAGIVSVNNCGSRLPISGSGRSLIGATLASSILLSVVAYLAVMASANIWVPLLLGRQFLLSIPIMSVALLSVPIAAVHVVMGRALISVGQVRLISIGTSVAMLGGTTLVGVMASMYGGRGAAIGIVSRDVLLSTYCVVAWILWRRKCGREEATIRIFSGA